MKIQECIIPHLYKGENPAPGDIKDWKPGRWYKFNSQLKFRRINVTSKGNYYLEQIRVDEFKQLHPIGINLSKDFQLDLKTEGWMDLDSQHGYEIVITF
jgi:hypothetical protein